MTAPTKPNAELAYRVLDEIDAHPETWDQSWWFTVTECGTSGCFAGWACLISGDKPSALGPSMDLLSIGESVSFVELPDGTTRYVSERAESLLGLDRDPARKLFDATNSREDLGRLVAEIFGPRPGALPPVPTPHLDSEGDRCECDDVPPNAGSAS